MKKIDFVKIVFIFLITIASVYISYDSLMNLEISLASFGATIGIVTSIYFVFGKKSFLPMFLIYFITLSTIGIIKTDMILYEMFFTVLLLFIPMVVYFVSFRFLMVKAYKINDFTKTKLYLKDLPKYLAITVIVALLGSLTRTLIYALLLDDISFLTVFFQTIIISLFGLWIFNGTIIFWYLYRNEPLENKNTKVFMSFSFLAVFISFSHLYFAGYFSNGSAYNLTFLVIFFFVFIGVYLTFDIILFANLLYLLSFVIFEEYHFLIFSFGESIIYINIVLLIGNLSAIAIKLLNMELYNKSSELEVSYQAISNIVSSTNKYLDNLDYMSGENNLFSQEGIIEMFEIACTILPKYERASCYYYGDKYINYISSKGFDINFLNKLKFSSVTVDNDINNNMVVKVDNFVSSTLEDDGYNEYVKTYGDLKESIRFTFSFSKNVVFGMSFDLFKENGNTFTDKDFDAYNTFNELFSAYTRISAIYNEKSKITTDIILSFIRTVGVYDEYTKVHSEEVANLTRALSNSLEMTSRNTEISYFAGLVHDIGKIGISPDILNKKGKLNNEEYEIIKNHTVVGFEILNDIESLKEIAVFIKHHHERWDGFGYPDRLKGEQIPFISQILSVSDSVSAMMHKRVYSDAMSIPEIIEELKREKGKQFSPIASETMINYLKNNY